MKTKEVSYQDMTTSALEELLSDYQNEKHAAEERVEWLAKECKTLQAIIDRRESETDDAE